LLILEPVVARSRMIGGLLRERGMSQKPERSDAIVDGDEDEVAGGNELAAVIERLRPAPEEERATVDPDHDGQGLRGDRLRGPDVESEAILVAARVDRGATDLDLRTHLGGGPRVTRRGPGGNGLGGAPPIRAGRGRGVGDPEERARLRVELANHDAALGRHVEGLAGVVVARTTPGARPTTSGPRPAGCLSRRTVVGTAGGLEAGADEEGEPGKTRERSGVVGVHRCRGTLRVFSGETSRTHRARQLG
jgi:hypothetical protein